MATSGPFCTPIVIGGTLQYFADVRAARSIINSNSAACHVAESSSSSSVVPQPSAAGAAAAFYSLDACFKMVEPVQLGEGE